MTADFGIGIAVDLEGNCRFYDLIRLKKLAKIVQNREKLLLGSPGLPCGAIGGPGEHSGAF